MRDAIQPAAIAWVLGSSVYMMMLSRRRELDELRRKHARETAELEARLKTHEDPQPPEPEP